MILQLKNIAKYFAGKEILQQINIDVKKKERIALVGRNGAGKSTLLKIIVGQLPYDEGEIIKIRDLTVGYLAQEHDLQSEKSIWEEMLTVYSSLMEEEQLLLEMTEKISELSTSDSIVHEKLLNEYSARQEKFAADGGYRYKSDVKGVLHGLGFSDEEFSLPIHSLSGGQKTRLALGKLLLENPDLLVLDEPTNHLDISTLSWLENYLTNYPGSIIVVSHDRYFLDKIVTKIYEISHRKAIVYHGTYSDYLRQKAERLESEQKRYEKQQEEIKRAEQFIERNIARASTSKRAQSKRKQLEKMEKIERPLTDTKTAHFTFDIAITSGREVLQTENYSFQFSETDEPLFKNVTFSIDRGERIALIGENGVGKTTLLKNILHDRENFILGTNVQIGYYSQEQETLTETNTILEEVWNAFPDKTELEIRTVLGNFLFSGDDALKPIHLLSGGEKARVALAKLMLQEANFLILDEPTNHLDLVSKEVLEEALLFYPGTILFVSHDRYFINKIADKIFELTKDGMAIYLGNYDYYVERKEIEAQKQKLLEEEAQLEESTEENVSSAALSYQEQKRRQREERARQRNIEKLENEIEVLEDKLADIEIEMTQPEIFNDHVKLNELSTLAEEMRTKIEALLEQWANLQ